jgi:hypothetical protein
MKKLISTTVMIAVFTTLVFSQNFTRTDSVSSKTDKQDMNRRHSIGSSLLILGNFAPGDPIDYYQLNYGYQLNKKDLIIVEVITWLYYQPYSFESFGPPKGELYPGKVRASGVGLGYQRFLWKKLYTNVEPTFFLQQFYDITNKKIQKGFQLYLQFVLGYRFEFCNKRLFIEPAFALKYWPVNTNLPASFANIEGGARKYKFDPLLNFGFRF